MLTSDFDFELPAELIAQEPPSSRAAARMMVLHRTSGAIEDRGIGDLPDYLAADDLLVLNDTRVFPARLTGVWSDTGGALELLLLEPRGAVAPVVWNCMAGSGRPIRAGQCAQLAGGRLEAEFLERSGAQSWLVRFHTAQPMLELLERHGLTPLPPYIKRSGEDEFAARLDRERYQTIYAREVGAVAAPTAGLHFTPELFERLDARGVERATITLHVGPGTFKPVKCREIEQHAMDAERYLVSEEAAAAIARCRLRGGRVAAVGSTTVRTLESVAAAHQGRIAPASGSSTLFIHPPYRFQVIDAMLTNFHLPQSTLLMMVAALVGRERILEAYRYAIARGYRFFSYGDCMLIYD